jgi:hypothetical protein
LWATTAVWSSDQHLEYFQVQQRDYVDCIETLLETALEEAGVDSADVEVKIYVMRTNF